MSTPSQKCNKVIQLHNKALVTDHKDCYSSWSLSMDEDFIVFCFGDDGTHTNSRPLNPEEEEKDYRQQHTESSSRRVCEVDGIEESGMVCVESRDSKGSSSTGSFAFPVLGLEWIGSPVQMPKSEERNPLKKQKARFVRFQCCRF